MNLPERYGSHALVLGASEGLGEAWARGLAAAGFELTVVARRAAELEAVAAGIRARLRVDCRALSMDLAAPELAERLAAIDDEKPVGLVVYNASFSPIDDFLAVPLEDKMKVVDVNARGPLIVSHVLGNRMAERGKGALILMSSLAGFQGSAMVATYAATKAFDTVLGEGLWEELGHRGVDVLVCAAGAILTPGFIRQTPERRRAAVFPMTPEAVVRETLERLPHPAPTFVPGRVNRFSRLFLGRLLSRRRAVRFISGRTRRMYDEGDP